MYGDVIKPPDDAVKLCNIAEKEIRFKALKYFKFVFKSDRFSNNKNDVKRQIFYADILQTF